jgi:acyl-homoserine lactone acylase PvdQ
MPRTGTTFSPPRASCPAAVRAARRRAALVRFAGGGLTGSLTAYRRLRVRDAGAASASTTPETAAAEILWDTWGVPHVFADDAPGLFFGFGWAQAHAHGDLPLRLDAQARGRGAEFFGPDYLVSVRAVRTMGLHRRGEAWYAAQSPAFRANLDAFAASHPDRLADAGEDEGSAGRPVPDRPRFRRRDRPFMR